MVNKYKKEETNPQMITEGRMISIYGDKVSVLKDTFQKLHISETHTNERE